MKMELIGIIYTVKMELIGINKSKENEMKEKALKLADELDGLVSLEPVIIKACEDMIRTLCWNLDMAEDFIKQYQSEVKELKQELFNKKNPVKEVFNNEPVAWIYERPNGSAKLVWVREPHDKSIIKEIPLYTATQVELNNGGEPVKNATYWKRQCNLLQATLTRLQSSLYHANEQIKYLESTPQTKPLSDEEIADAKRYRYLRENCYSPRSPNSEYDLSMELKFMVSGIWSDNHDKRVLDSLIDKAIEAKLRGEK